MKPLRAQSVSSHLSWLRVGTIAVFAIVAFAMTLFAAWRLVDLMESDPRAIPHFPFLARMFQLLATFACLVCPFILLGLILIRERAFGKILGILTMFASATLAAAVNFYGHSSVARVSFEQPSSDSRSLLTNLLSFAFLAGLVILGIAVYSGETRLAEEVGIPRTAEISLYGKRNNEAHTETPLAPPVHYRLNWAQVLVVAILWVASLPILVVGPLMEEPVISPDGTYLLIGLSRVLFSAAAILLFILVLTRRRAIGVMVGSLIASSGLAVVAAFIIALSRPIGRDYFNWPDDLELEAFFLLPTPLLGLAIIALCTHGFAYGASNTHDD